MRNRKNRTTANDTYGIKPIRSNPFFPGEVKSLSNALGVLWRELATSVNKKILEPISFVSVTDYGAVGDGTTDDTTAVQDAIDSGYASIFFPEGEYLLTANITVTGDKDYRLFGSGMGTTKLIFEDLFGLVVELDGFLTPREFSIADMSVLSNSAGGTGLKITRTSASSIESGINIQNMAFSPADGVHTGATWWERAIDIDDCRFITLDNVRIWGMEANDGSAVDGVRIKTTTIAQKQFQVFVDKLSIGNFRTGVRVEGAIEGIYWNKSEIFTCRNPLIVDRTGAVYAGTVLIGESHFAGSASILQFTNVTTVGISNSEIFHGWNESGGPFDATLISIDTTKNSRIVGAKVTSSFGATKAVSGIVLVDATESTIGGGTVVRGFSDNGISLTGCDQILVDDALVIGTAGTSVGIFIDSTSTDITIGNVPTLNVLVGVDDDATNTVRQYRDYQTTVNKTLTGGSPSEYVDLAIPSGMFDAKPTYVDAVVNSSTSSQFLVCAYYYDATESTATNARVTVSTLDGSNITAATRRFMFVAKRNI